MHVPQCICIQTYTFAIHGSSFSICATIWAADFLLSTHCLAIECQLPNVYCPLYGIIYTSGTTGNPKAVMIHHDGVIAQGAKFEMRPKGQWTPSLTHRSVSLTKVLVASFGCLVWG